MSDSGFQGRKSSFSELQIDYQGKFAGRIMSKSIGSVCLVAGIFVSVLLVAMPDCGGASDAYGQAVRVVVLTEDGGHLDWHPREDLIAFDRRESSGYFRLWLMQSDGSKQCPLNISVPGFPTRHAGQPAWHPSGDYLAVQAQQQNCPRWIDTKAVPGAGLLNDLWIISADGHRGWKVAVPACREFNVIWSSL